MSLLTAIKSALGIGASTVASAPLMGIPAAVTEGARAAAAVANGIREANRSATLRAIAAELERKALAFDAAILASQHRKKTAHITIPPAVALVALLALVGMGCASVPPPSSSLSEGNVGRLVARPDFNAAVDAAPEWVRDAGNTIISLEGDLKVERARANQIR